MEILKCNYFTCSNLCCFGRVASSPPWSWSETCQTNCGRVIDTDKTRQVPVKMLWKDVIREEKSLCPCNHTQREMLPCSIVERPCPLRRLPFVAIVGRAGDTFPTPRAVSVLLRHMIERSQSRPLSERARRLARSILRHLSLCLAGVEAGPLSLQQYHTRDRLQIC